VFSLRSWRKWFFSREKLRTLAIRTLTPHFEHKLFLSATPHNVNPWGHFPRLITSIDFLKRERLLRSFRETLPAGEEAAYPRRYDLLIVDEAHNVAPSGRGQYATESMTKAWYSWQP
jgi:superfamily II DNA or RNA helicase